MKTILGILTFGVLAVLLYLNSFAEKRYDLDVVPILPDGQTNPPLRKIGNEWPLPEGTRLWFKSNTLPSLTVKGTEDGHVVALDRYGDQVRVPRKYVENLLTEFE